LQLIRVIRNKYNENIGIIAVTGKHSNELQYGFLKYGADDYITKPFTKDRFNAIIVNNFRRIQQLDQIKSYVRLVEEMSITDHLTRCYNRFYLDSTLEVYIEKYVRYNRPFSILIIDIDHFKLVNDTFGHQAGDKVLIQFVNLIKTNIRKIDILGRWGGEEFLIICPETNLSDTVKLAEKLVKCIENGVFDNNLKITCSIGVAEYKMNEVRESVVKRADDALYIAKDSGRNKVAYL
ncbi:MAG: diguanylate cyclase, partial [Spirochaetota bacterium]|nr:diguanylate cyclase [Spirochaetota bacterium]